MLYPSSGQRRVISSCWTGLLLVIHAAALTGLLFRPTLATAAESDGRAKITAVDREKSGYLGLRKCKLCHDRKHDPTDKDFGLTDFVSLAEFQTWYDRDSHAQAYKILEDALGKRIGQNMGIQPSNSERCLSCHTTWSQNYRPSEEERKFGVTCESCHGPGGQWFVPHIDPPWRTKTSQEKERLGMVDVRNAVKRAQRCLSCHMGNATEGKIITHEMYAAGHPPLSGIEPETFLRQMPSHAIPLSKKSDTIKGLLNYDPKESARTKSVILGGVVALRDSVRYFGALATTKEREIVWPDFAAYNCFACHHELRSSISWRQRRGYPYAAGYPQMHEWPEALIKLGIFHAATDQKSYEKMKQEYREKLNKLYQAINTRPFGDATRVGSPQDKHSASGELITWLDRVISGLESSRYDQKAAVRALRKLSEPEESDEPARSSYPDYDHARQISWAMMQIYNDIEPEPSRDSEIREVFRRLSMTLNLESQADQSKGRRKTQARLVEMSESAARYDPAWFKKQLQTLATLFPR